MTARLPVVVHPRPGQALDCYLEHLADANALTTAALLHLLTPVGGRSGHRFLMLTPQTEVLGQLAELTGRLDAEFQQGALSSISAIDLDGFDPCTPASYRTVAARGWLLGHGTYCCPECLAQDGVWRLDWRLATTTVCIRHRRVLLSQCPACRRVFRDQRHSPLRSLGARTICGNPIGQGPREHCRQNLTELNTEAAAADCVDRQRQHHRALHAGEIRLCTGTVTATEYLQSLTATAALMLHLAPLLADPPDWAAELNAGLRRRWAIRPPENLGTRGRVLTAAHQLLTAGDLDTAAERFQPWLNAVPATNECSLGWIAGHTRMTASLTRVVMSGSGHRHRVPAHLARISPLAAPDRIPQAVPTDLVERHLEGLFASRPHVVATFAALCLAKAGHRERTWADAGRILGLPEDLAHATARTAIRHLTASPAELTGRLDRLSREMTTVNYRERESRIRALAADDTWFAQWRRCRPRTRPPARSLAVAWLWTRYASGHLACVPVQPRHRLRDHLRGFSNSLDEPAKSALLAIAERAKP